MKRTSLFLLLTLLTLTHVLNAQRTRTFSSSCRWQVQAGSNFTIGLATDSTLWGWGYNGAYGFGNGGTTSSNTPVLLDSVGKWTMIACGNLHVLAIREDGTLWAWGRNEEGQVGDGTFINKSTRTQIGNQTDWQRITAGSYSSFGIRENGTLWAWGQNSNWTLGDGTTSNRNVPTQIGSGTNWKSVSNSFDFTVGLQQDGSLWTWGNNSFGQLGNDTINQFQTTPATIAVGTVWKDVSAGNYHALAIQQNGTLWAWGYNQAGQLGDGSNTTRYHPIQVGTDSHWQQLCAGPDVSYAIKYGGTLWGWGANSNGGIGDSSFINKIFPTPIGTNAYWKLVDRNSSHSVAITLGHNLWAWGTNVWGEIGNGQSNGVYYTPTPVGLCSPLELNAVTLEAVLVYPNPAHDVLNISGYFSVPMPYSLYNSVGETVASGMMKNQSQIPVGHLTNGLYVLRIGQQYIKWLKEQYA